uniref:Uncharacterized protein n=1 Tax=Romanomermis culicivorax TaxID=13658 RepID=A0A915ING5_ROMCU
MAFLILLQYYFLLYNFLLLSFSFCDHHEKQLFTDLLNEQNYNPLARPVKNSNDSVLVYLGLILQQVLDVDEKNEQIHTSVVLHYIAVKLKMTSNNRLLQPSPVLFKGLHLKLSFSVAEQFDRTFPADIIVKHTGHVTWKTPAIMVSSCNMNVRWFPFDEQKCKLKFGSWTYGSLKINLKPDARELDVSECKPNGEWTILNDTAASVESKVYACCPDEPYPSITFVIHIRRRTLFYGFNLIIPSLLITMMTVLGFTLPTEAGEKLTLETTILMSVCFMLGLVADQTPATSEAIPLISTFFFSVNVVVSTSVLFTTFVINFHHRTCHTNEMTPLVRSIFLNWAPWLLMMKRPDHLFTYQTARLGENNIDSCRMSAQASTQYSTTSFNGSLKSIPKNCSYQSLSRAHKLKMQMYNISSSRFVHRLLIFCVSIC